MSPARKPLVERKMPRSSIGLPKSALRSDELREAVSHLSALVEEGDLRNMDSTIDQVEGILQSLESHLDRRNNLLWGRLQEIDPALFGAVQVMKEDRAQIGEMSTHLRVLLERWKNNSGEKGELLLFLRSFSHKAHRHFSEEERLIQPVSTRYFTPEELAQINNSSAYDGTQRDAADHSVNENHSEEEKLSFWKGITTPVRVARTVLVRKIFKDDWKKLRRK